MMDVLVSFAVTLQEVIAVLVWSENGFWGRELRRTSILKYNA